MKIQAVFRTLALCLATCAALMWPAVASAHNLPYSLVTLKVAGDGRFDVSVNCHVAALITGLPQAHLPPEARQQFAAMPDQEVAQRVAVMAGYVAQTIDIEADGHRLATPAPRFPTIPEVRFDAAQTPDSQTSSAPITLQGQLPSAVQTITVYFPPEFGSVLLNVQTSGGATSVQAMTPGEKSQPIRVGALQGGERAAPVWPVTVGQYVSLGFQHIVPEGLDHILFVLSLFLLIPRWAPLAKQVTAFTLAHSVTLALAVLGIFTLPPRFVETMIAVSIAVVALDNIRTSTLAPWRPALVFGFGFLHGMGFASVLKALGLPKGQKALALASFNVGIELGQLTVLVVAFALLGWTIRKSWYRQRVVIPLSVVIACVAGFWAVQRAFFS